jgi:ribosome-interacting GTPase 1
MGTKGIKIIVNNSKTTISNKLIKEILKENKILNCEVLIHKKNYSVENFIGAMYKNVEYKKAIICLNKMDLFSKEEIENKKKELKELYPNFDIFEISADKNINIEEFKDFIFKKLNFIWVYLKEAKKKTDFTKPLIVEYNSTLKEVCNKIHQDFFPKFRYAKIKGKSAKFEWQQVGSDHIVKDRDEIEIFLK